MSLLELYVRRSARPAEKGVEVRVIGSPDRLGPRTRAALEGLVIATRAAARTLRLNLAISYGSRTEIVDARGRLAERVARGTLVPEEIDETSSPRTCTPPETLPTRTC
jgi:undecaprenyl diphosphate synthase